ncbi:MAG TPA: DUF2080 family transposase-associated protein [Clostridia bacterium]|nr:DUF2080 family transposase-associated protein [Clostridia bacterium]
MATKIKIVDAQEEIEITAALNLKAKPFGKGGCHVTLPTKYIGYSVLVLIKTKTGQWIKGFEKSFNKLK